MNLLDVAVLVLAFGAAVGGHRLGFLARALSWIGLALGLYLGARIVARLLGAVGTATADERLVLVIGILLAAAFVGQALGTILGGRLHAVLPLGPLRSLDRVVGALAGALGVFVALWLLLPAISSVAGGPARAARGSAISRFLSTLREPPNTLEALRRLVGQQAFPRVFDTLGNSPDTGAPPAASPLTTERTAAVGASTVRIEGQACDRIQDGSGFTVGPHLVVTNAHVVAGEPAGQTTVIEPSGLRLPAAVVRFDPDRDLALLSVPGLSEPALALAGAALGERGAVFGHPGGHTALAVTPARVSSRVSAVGHDLYDTHTTDRDVLVLAADLAPGDSGGALVDRAGSVIGVAFAIDPGRSGTSYALSSGVLGSFLAARPGPAPVSTEGCLTA